MNLVKPSPRGSPDNIVPRSISSGAGNTGDWVLTRCWEDFLLEQRPGCWTASNGARERGTHPEIDPVRWHGRVMHFSFVFYFHFLSFMSGERLDMLVSYCFWGKATIFPKKKYLFYQFRTSALNSSITLWIVFIIIIIITLISDLGADLKIVQNLETKHVAAKVINFHLQSFLHDNHRLPEVVQC